MLGVLRATAFCQCHSARPFSSPAGPTPSPQLSEALLLPGVRHASVRTRSRATTTPLPRARSLHARSHVRQLSRSPTGRSAHVPASRPECVAVTYAHTHARSEPERRSASLSFISG